jgi:hypothetical protein
VDAFNLANAAAMRVCILTLGCIIARLEVPDRDGKPANVVLGSATISIRVPRQIRLSGDLRPTQAIINWSVTAHPHLHRSRLALDRRGVVCHQRGGRSGSTYA